MASLRTLTYKRTHNVHRVSRRLSDGRVNYHYYHRPTRTKLPGQPGSPEFLAVYQECERRLFVATKATKSDGRTTLQA